MNDDAANKRVTQLFLRSCYALSSSPFYPTPLFSLVYAIGCCYCSVRQSYTSSLRATSLLTLASPPPFFSPLFFFFMQGILDSISAGRRAQIAALEQQIEQQKKLKTSMEGVPDFFEAVREYEAIRREVEFREQLDNAHKAAIGKLENMVAIESSVRSREQAEIVAFLAAEVPKALKGKVRACVCVWV